MMKLIVIYCLVLNPTMCKPLEMVPEDLHPVTSAAECLRGGAVGAMTFVVDHAEYFVKGWRCEQVDEVSAQLHARVR